MKSMQHGNGKRCVWVTFAFLLFWTNAFVQTLDADFYDQREGLPSAFIYDLQTDGAGRLLIATDRGLASFNGRAFSTFNSADGLADDFVTTIARGGFLTYWLGHYSGALTYYDGHAFQAVSQFEIPQRVQAIVPIDTINHTLLAIGYLGGLELLKNGKSSGVHCVVPAGMKFHSACQWGEQAILLGTDQGLRLLELTDSVATMGEVSKPIKGVVSSIVSVSAQEAVAVVEGKLVYVHQQSDRLRVTELSSAMQLPQTGGIQLTIDANSFLWVMDGNSIYSFDLDRSAHRLTLVSDWQESQQVFSPLAQTLHTDNQGQHWIGTRGKGLVRVKEPIIEHYSTETFTAPEQCRAALQLDDNNWLIGSEAGLTEVIFSENFDGGWQHKTLRSGVSVRALCQTKSGVVVVGTENAGVLSLDPKQKNSWQTTYPTMDRINHLSVDEQGTIWVATTTQGILMLDSNGGLQKQFTMRNGLSHNNVKSVYHDREGRHWLSIKGGQLTCLAVDGSVDAYYGPEQGLKTVDFNGVAEATDGSIWVATGDAGLFYLSDSGFVSFKNQMDTRLGNSLEILPINAANADLLVLTEAGCFWIHSGQKKVVGSRMVAAFKNRGLAHLGLQLSASKHLLVPGVHGISKFNPNAFVAEPAPQVVFHKTLLDERPWLAQKNAIGADVKRLTFEFDAINIASAKEPNYWYKLEGYDKGWIGPVNHNKATYTNLYEGDYEFKVRSGDSWDLAGPIAASGSFAVLPPFYRSWWFVLGALLAFVALVATTIKVREHQLRQTNQRLEAIVTERTDELRKQNNKIKEFTYGVTHDLKAPVNNLVALIKMMRSGQPMEGKQEQLVSMIEETGNTMRGNIDRLMKVIRNYEEAEDDRSTVDVEALISELEQNIHTLIHDSDAKLINSIHSNQVTFSKQDLFSVLYNLVTNAIKYRAPERSPEIRISTRTNDGFFELKVADNGLGMDLTKDRDALFGKFQRIHVDAEGSGIGLHLTKKLVESHGGQISVESEPGVGSCFTVLLPLNAEANG